jgi:hypothetical protein
MTGSRAGAIVMLGSRMRRKLLLIAMLAVIGSVSCTSSSRTSSETTRSAPAHLVIDVPGLAFAKSAAVRKVLGPPTMWTKSKNGRNWSEGPVVEARFKRTECTFFWDRLIGIDYAYSRKPADAAEALEWAGLPRSAVSLDGDHADHLPFRAFYAPTAEYRNPIRCCGGLVLYWVSIPADRSLVRVTYANINDRFADWPDEIRQAWLRKGGPAIASDTRITVRPGRGNPLYWRFEPSYTKKGK